MYNKFHQKLIKSCHFSSEKIWLDKNGTFYTNIQVDFFYHKLFVHWTFCKTICLTSFRNIFFLIMKLLNYSIPWYQLLNSFRTNTFVKKHSFSPALLLVNMLINWIQRKIYWLSFCSTDPHYNLIFNTCADSQKGLRSYSETQHSSYRVSVLQFI